jgi:hypothetical protein
MYIVTANGKYLNKQYYMQNMLAILLAMCYNGENIWRFNMRKKILAVVVVCAVVLSLTACGGSGGDPVSDFEYRYNAELGGIEITKYVGDLIKVRIPGKIEGEPVVSIGDRAFGESGIMEVYVPNGVTNIGSSAFWGCTGLTSITIPNSVTNIDKGAFSWCENLTNAVYKGISYSVETERERREAERERRLQELEEEMRQKREKEDPNNENPFRYIVAIPPDNRAIDLPQEFYDAINGE